MAVIKIYELPCAIIEACGLDPSSIKSMVFEYTTGEIPTLTVTSMVFEPGALGEITERYELVPIEP